MGYKTRESLLVRFVVILFLLCEMLGAAPNQKAWAASQQSTLDLRSMPESGACSPNTGWIWTGGPSRPDSAREAELAFQQKGIASEVTASDYGEKDSCGNFEPFSIDFMVTLKSGSARQLSPNTESRLAQDILAALSQLNASQLGNVQIDFGSGVVKSYSSGSSTQALGAQTVSPSGPSLSAAPLFDRKVFLLVYDPILSTGQDLDTYMGWPAYTTLAQGIIDSFKSVSHGQLQYTIVKTQVVTDQWPLKVDGFRYTQETYLPVVQKTAPAHDPDLLDYGAVIDDPQLDLCGKLNRGEIDELWIYGMPYSGLYESTLAGPDAYWFNSPPVGGMHTCAKLLPIMGLNYERGLAEAMHSFGHRAESTMAEVYGSWAENSAAHNWDRFALVKAMSPAYSYSGCGNVHFPPNGTSDYDYSDADTVQTNCEDFGNYPNLSDPLTIAGPVTCAAWSCDHLSYMLYWFSHLPSYAGCGPDRVASNWWSYFAAPSLALSPSLNCPPVTPDPSHNPLYLSLANDQIVGDIPAGDEDILLFDGAGWSLFFDGSDVGLRKSDLVAFCIVDADTILMVFDTTVKVNGIIATPQDILRFDATSLGSNTAGTFSLYFDGSDVGLNNPTTEKIDALSLLPDGRLLISTNGNPVVPGVSRARDEDVLAFTPTSLGKVTSGSWSLYFDGSDAGLSGSNGEDIDGLDVVGGNLYLSTRGNFSVSGVSGADEDVFVCAATSLGDVTACTFSPDLYFDGSMWGLAANDVDAFKIPASGSIPAH